MTLPKTTLLNIYGKPTLLLRVDTRQIDHQDYNKLPYLMGSLLLVGLVVGGIILLLLKRLNLFQRLSQSESYSTVAPQAAGESGRTGEQENRRIAPPLPLSLSPPPLLPPLDTKALQALRNIAGEDASEIITKVIDSYLEDAPQLLQAINAAITQGNATALLNAAHTLKSTTATLGATKLSQLCKDLEIMGRAGTTSDALVLASQVKAEYARVQAALQIERQDCLA